jgi:hypothetical protein
MTTKNIFRPLILITLFVVPLLMLTGGFYIWWNQASPEKTCTNCHEINHAFNSWSESAHRGISCKECHGTALSNGLHSLQEKSRMVFSHLKYDMHNDNIRLSEAQILETMDRCRNCHQSEYAKWQSGGHSVHYAAIFLNENQNQKEQLNYDCLRCHGMFYEKTIDDLVEPISTEGPWKLKELEKAHQPTIPCMACHNIHSPGLPLPQPDYSEPKNIFYGRNISNKSLGFYSRHEKIHFSPASLPEPVIMIYGDTVRVPSDPVYRLCVQCHAPSVWHEAGTSDDRTPVGVHEGISCRACHEPHSNNQRNSCDKCHPGISNCNLDVKTMNTSYMSPSSPNNIHFVSCKSCHDDKPARKKIRAISAQ